MSCGEHIEVNTLILGQKGIGRWKRWHMQAFLQAHLLNESLNRPGSQDTKSSNILAEGEYFSFFPSASPHHSLVSVGSQGKILAWLERAWDTRAAWPFLLITKHSTSHNCEPHCSHTQGAIKVLLGSCQQLIFSMPTHIQWCCLMALDAATLTCVLTGLLFTQFYYIPVTAATALPQHCPRACLSHPLFIKVSEWLKCAISSFSSLPSPRDACLLSWACSVGFPIPQQSVTGFRTV